MAILPDLSQLDRSQLEAMVLAMNKGAQRRLTLKVAKSGAISLYGVGRFPVTLYAKTWHAVLDMADDIRAFAELNKALLSQGKDDPRFAKTDA